MELISPQIEEALKEQETHPYNVPLARKTLEASLAHQLIQLSNGLFAWLILHEPKLGKAVWQHQYYTYKNQLVEHFQENPEEANLTIRDYMKKFSTNIAIGKTRVITESELNEFKLRIYGGYIKLWDASRINDQLANLGSEYRFAFLGQEETLYNEIMCFLSGSNLCPHPIDARFIFGKVGSVTTLPFCPLFHFKDELVTSPLLKPESAGFTFNHDHIVIRQYILDTLESSSKNKDIEGTKVELEAEKLKELRFLHSLTHESIHVLSFSERQRYLYTLFNWREGTKRDILRYLQCPKSIENLHDVFKVNFENILCQEDSLFNKLDAELLGFLGMNMIDFLRKNSLEKIVDEMLLEGSIIYNNKEQLKSTVFEEGKKWEI